MLVSKLGELLNGGGALSGEAAQSISEMESQTIAPRLELHGSQLTPDGSQLTPDQLTAVEDEFSEMVSAYPDLKLISALTTPKDSDDKQELDRERELARRADLNTGVATHAFKGVSSQSSASSLVLRSDNLVTTKLRKKVSFATVTLPAGHTPTYGAFNGHISGFSPISHVFNYEAMPLSEVAMDREGATVVWSDQTDSDANDPPVHCVNLPHQRQNSI